jgi:hypothetical protein
VSLAAATALLMMPFSRNLSAIENILSTQSLLNFNASAQSDFLQFVVKIQHRYLWSRYSKPKHNSKNCKKKFFQQMSWLTCIISDFTTLLLLFTYASISPTSN